VPEESMARSENRPQKRYGQWWKILQASTTSTEVVGARTQREPPSVCVTSRSAVRLVEERRHTMFCLVSTKPAMRARHWS